MLSIITQPSKPSSFQALMNSPFILYLVANTAAACRFLFLDFSLPVNLKFAPAEICHIKPTSWCRQLKFSSAISNVSSAISAVSRKVSSFVAAYMSHIRPGQKPFVQVSQAPPDLSSYTPSMVFCGILFLHNSLVRRSLVSIFDQVSSIHVLLAANMFSIVASSSSATLCKF